MTENEQNISNASTYGSREILNDNSVLKPRRWNESVLCYCLAIPFPLTSNSTEERNDLICNILKEIEHEIASLATNEKGSQFLEELLLAIEDEFLLRMFWKGVLGYVVYLSTHRYGSHVLQSLLHKMTENVSSCFQKNNEEENGESSDLVPSLEECFIKITEEVIPHVNDLIIHVCASHVVRSLICSLGGVKLVRKNKKEEVVPVKMSYISCDIVLLNRLSNVIINGDHDEVRKWSCHPSAGSCLRVLLQVMTYIESPDENFDALKLKKDSKANDLCMILIYNNDKDAYVIEKYSKNVVASTILELILQYSYEEFYDEMIHHLDNIPKMLQGNVSNFVLQSVLSNCHTKEQALFLFGKLETSTILSNNVHVNCLKYSLFEKNRRCVFWRVVGMCTKFQIHQDKIFQSIQTACYDAFMNKDATKKRKKQQKMNLQDCIPLFVWDTNHQDSTKMDLTGVRIVHQLLHFHNSPKASHILDAIINNFEMHQLETIIKDGTISRYIIDGILDNPQKNTKPFTTYISLLFTKLQGKWASLAVHRIGQYTVIKLFHTLPTITEQTLLVTELANSWNRLQGSTFAENVTLQLNIEEFVLKGEVQWKQWVKQVNLLNKTPISIQNYPKTDSSPTQSTSNKDDDVDDFLFEKVKKKKHKKKKKSH